MKINSIGHVSEIPSLIVGRLLDSFSHQSSSMIHSSRSHLCKLPKLSFSPFISFFDTTLIILMCFLWKGNHCMVCFHFQFFQKRQNEIKKNYNFITILQKNLRIQLGHTSPFLGFGSQKHSNPFNFILRSTRILCQISTNGCLHCGMEEKR
jgi:hypothetical protein